MFPWNMRLGPTCLGGLYEFAQDPRAKEYLEDENEEFYYLMVPPHVQADFLYVPLAYAKPFATLATLLMEHGVWLECAIPILVDQLVRLHGADVMVLQLCTDWNPKRRGRPEMMDHCDRRSLPQEPVLYHPLKMGKDPSVWEAAFERINQGLA